MTRSQPALAASLSLRCYAVSTPRSDDLLRIQFADIDVGKPGGFSWEWNVGQLPWDAIAHRE